MGCGASSSKGINVSEPQNTAAPRPCAVQDSAPAVNSSPAHGPTSVQAGAAMSPTQQPEDSPNSRSKLSGAATPVLGTSTKEFQGTMSVQMGAEENDLVSSMRSDLASSIRSDSLESKLRRYGEPSLQERVNLLESFVQTQNVGKMYSVQRAPFENEGVEEEEEEEEEEDKSELDRSWRSKIFSYDGTETPHADLPTILSDTSWAKEVEIKDSKIDVEGVNLLDQIVRTRELRALTLARCNLEDDITVHIARFLKGDQWSSLRSLGLDGNRMLGDQSAEALAQALMTNTTLHGMLPFVCLDCSVSDAVSWVHSPLFVQREWKSNPTLHSTREHARKAHCPRMSAPAPLSLPAFQSPRTTPDTC
jgi:hypothetical protein